MTDETNYALLIGKKVFLVTKLGRKYTGLVKTFDVQHLSMIDKFDSFVIISTDDIHSVEEVKE